MKNEDIYAAVRRLIDERELVEENLDLAEEQLAQVVDEDYTCAWAFGLLSEVYYWRGEVAASAEKLEMFQTGVEFGEAGIASDEQSLEANFWLGVNYGQFGQEKGVMQSLSLINPIRQCFERTLAKDESYFYGGPWRGLGRLYHKAPGWPISIGNTTKGVEYLEKALRFGPTFYLNRLFLAEAYLAAGNKKKAREHLEWMVNAPLSPRHEREDESYKRDAQAWLNRL